MRRHVNPPFPTIAVVGLCFSLLALAITITLVPLLSFGFAFFGLILCIGSTSLFGGVVAAWVFS